VKLKFAFRAAGRIRNFANKSENLRQAHLMLRNLGFVFTMPTEAGYLGGLQKAVEHKHQCLAAHSHTVFVNEKSADKHVPFGYANIPQCPAMDGERGFYPDFKLGA